MKKYLRYVAALATVLVMTVSLGVPAFALDDPKPHCTAAIVVDGDNNEILYDFNAYEKRYPASVTKIMTTLVILRAIDAGELSLDTQVTASKEAVTLPEGSSTAGIVEGEVLTIEQLLYCDLVPSGNEACNILAEALGGSEEAFVERMNQTAANLGMTGTHFANPHGLHDPDHYSTAYDIYLMASAAMKYDIFRKIVSTATYTLEPTNKVSEPRVLHSTNALISNWYVSGVTYSKAIGIKTGYTEEAGRCLASAATDKQGRTFYCVVLGSEYAQDAAGNWKFHSFSESSRLLEWGFDNFTRTTLLSETSDNVIREIPVTLAGDVGHVLAQPVGSIEATMPNDFDPAQAEVKMDLPKSLEAPVTKGQVVGSVSLVYNGVTYGTLDMVATDDVARSNFQYTLKVISDTWALWWVKLLVIAVVVFILLGIFYLLLIRPAQRGHRRKYSYTSSRRSSYRGRRR